MADSLHTKRKSQMSDKERIRDFQRKLYRKAKQEQGKARERAGFIAVKSSRNWSADVG